MLILNPDKFLYAYRVYTTYRKIDKLPLGIHKSFCYINILNNSAFIQTKLNFTILNQCTR